MSRKSNWKRRGLDKPTTNLELINKRIELKRAQRLAELPSDIRRIIEEQPQLAKFV